MLIAIEGISKRYEFVRHVSNVRTGDEWIDCRYRMGDAEEFAAFSPQQVRRVWPGEADAG